MAAKTTAVATKTPRARRMSASESREAGSGAVTTFAFGDPESVLDRREISQYFQVWNNGRWYEPPLPLAKLAAAFNVSPHHRSAVALKVNMLVAQHIETRWLDGENFERNALDFVQIGNSYFEQVPNLGGRVAMLKTVTSMYMRRAVKDGGFVFVNDALGQEFVFEPGRVFQLQQPDVAQELYGLPEWLGALQSSLLGENATLFRRRYYLNGAHMGFILYSSEATMDTKTVEEVSRQIRAGKGAGNFKNLFLHVPNGKKDGIQLLPVGETTARDEFSSIKTISAEDQLAAHRVPPVLLGMVPKNSAGFGSIHEARDAFFAAEIVPLMKRMLRVNAWAGVPALAFADYVCSNGDVIKPDGTRVPAAQGGATRR